MLAGAAPMAGVCDVLKDSFTMFMIAICIYELSEKMLIFIWI
jgi:hypothetical protein